MVVKSFDIPLFVVWQEDGIGAEAGAGPEEILPVVQGVAGDLVTSFGGWRGLFHPLGDPFQTHQRADDENIQEDHAGKQDQDGRSGRAGPVDKGQDSCQVQSEKKNGVAHAGSRSDNTDGDAQKGDAQPHLAAHQPVQQITPTQGDRPLFVLQLGQNRSHGHQVGYRQIIGKMVTVDESAGGGADIGELFGQKPEFQPGERHRCSIHRL
ncbi:hypothetical protein MIT9_P1828 [Methylomarinovum caldicuralii]|uniref:Uncharacterized protein n=1 Tax=Methylomarinovum caldicuralii TaxID=438856 RepID=A0AAU9C3J0_9GAMM|nr:hypothetical protein MIT9_P1828 [Methylomarinovum caldicuralii]